MKTIVYKHAGDLATSEAHALEWTVGDRNSRHQEIAICNGRVIGAWDYSLESRRRRWAITSAYTEVHARFRRRGIARELWLRGVALWDPCCIEASIASNEGREFLATMEAVLAHRRPKLWLTVTLRSEDKESWQEARAWAAIYYLRELGETKAPAKLLALASG